MSDLVSDYQDENPKKRLKTNPNTVFEIQKINSFQKTILEFSKEECDNITSNSEYIKTLIDQYSSEYSDQNPPNSIFLAEIDSNEAASFLTMLSKPMDPNLSWKKYFVDLSAKWIVPKYIEVYYSMIKDFFQSYRISKNNVFLSIFTISGELSSYHRYCYKNGKFIDSNNTTLSEINCFYKNSKNVWCHKSIDEEFTQFRTDSTLTELWQLSGTWISEDRTQYRFAFKKCPPKLRKLNDLIKFCEIVELILTHDCYHNTYISSVKNLYEYLHTHEDFATKDTLNRLFQTKDDLLEYTTFKSLQKYE